MRSTTSFCSMKCWSAMHAARTAAGGTGWAWRCCRAGCPPRACFAGGAISVCASAREVDLQHIGLDDVAAADARAAARPGRGPARSPSGARAARPAAASAPPGPGPISTIASPGCGSISRTMRVDDRGVGQEVLAEALAGDVLRAGSPRSLRRFAVLDVGAAAHFLRPALEGLVQLASRASMARAASRCSRLAQLGLAPAPSAGSGARRSARPPGR